MAYGSARNDNRVNLQVTTLQAELIQYGVILGSEGYQELMLQVERHGIDPVRKLVILALDAYTRGENGSDQQSPTKYLMESLTHHDWSRDGKKPRIH